MKNSLFTISLVLFTLQIAGQSFTRSQVYDDLTLLGQNTRSLLFDHDNDGDDDIICYGGTGDSRIIIFENNNGAFDSSFVLYDNNSSIDNVLSLDFNNDGNQDLIVNESGNVITFENVGNGSFLQADPGTFSPSLSDNVKSMDVNHDGISDLLDPDSSNMIWYEGLGNGSFNTSGSILFTADNPFSRYEVIDMDNNGTQEIVVIDTVQDIAKIYYDAGSNSYTMGETFSIPSFLGGYSFSDFNDDDWVDFACANLSSESVVIIWNDQTNNLNTSSVIKDYSSMSNEASGSVGSFDFDNDGDNELLIGEETGNTATSGIIMLNNGNQSFVQHSEMLIGADWDQNDKNMFFSDFDQDGKLDVLTANLDDSDVIVHRQNNNNGFLPPSYLNHYFEGIHSFDILDYNNDNNLDLVTVTNANGGKLEVAYGNGNNEFTNSDVLIDNRTAYGAKGSQLTFWNNNNDRDLVFSSGNKVYVHLDYETNDDTVVELFTSNPSSSFGTIGYINDVQRIFTIKDIDNDGDNDLLIPQSSSNPIGTNSTFFWIENTGNATYNVRSIDSGFSRYLLLDVDIDGDQDFIGSKSGGGGTEYVFYKMDASTKTFNEYLTIPFTENITSVQFTSGDIDDDGDEDIVTSGIKWLENDGAGNFAAPADLLTGYNTVSNVVVDDIDNDGLVDVITNVSGFQSQKIAVLFNQDNNVFSPMSQELEISISSQQTIATADFNDNGFKSIIVGSAEEFGWTPILFNFCINTENTIDLDICSGDSYTFADGSVQDNITQDVTYVSTLTGQAANGCDVIVTENITVITVSDVTTTTTNETITANNPNATYVWLDCDNNFAPIPGESGQSFTATENGNYAVEITEDGCVEVSECVTITTLSIKDSSLNEQVSVYPNPTLGNLNIDLYRTHQNVQIVVRNITGQKIMSRVLINTSNAQLNLAQLESGFYFLEIHVDENTLTKKIIKN